MNHKNLGRLAKVDLREEWASESGDFTPWLAEEENLNLLGEVIGIQLELASREQNVGPFRADLLCKDVATDEWVLIENQIEKTDHPHLGQILTYAAGLNVVTVVWIAEHFTEEHRAALDWLNEHTDEKINFFGLEIELWRIGDSRRAPKFNIVSQPNDWSRTIQQSAAGSREMSETKQLQLKFWTGFKAYMETIKSFIRCQKPFPQHWTNHPIGRSGVHLTSIVSTWNSESGEQGSEVRSELYLDGPDAKREFAALERQKESIERDLGFKLTWHNPENKAMSRLFARGDFDFRDEGQWPKIFGWLREHLETMHTVFAPIVRTLKIEGIKED